MTFVPPRSWFLLYISIHLSVTFSFSSSFSSLYFLPFSLSSHSQDVLQTAIGAIYEKTDINSDGNIPKEEIRKVRPSFSLSFTPSSFLSPSPALPSLIISSFSTLPLISIPSSQASSTTPTKPQRRTLSPLSRSSRRRAAVAVNLVLRRFMGAPQRACRQREPQTPRERSPSLQIRNLRLRRRVR